MEDFPISFGIARQPLTAYRWATRGLETRRGRQITDDDFEQIKATPFEAGGKAIGFQPVRVSEHYAKAESERAIEKWYLDKRRVLIQRIAKAKENSRELLNAKMGLENLNEEWEKRGTPFTPPKIDRDTFKESVLPIRSKRAKELKRNVK